MIYGTNNLRYILNGTEYTIKYDGISGVPQYYDHYMWVWSGLSGGTVFQMQDLALLTNTSSYSGFSAITGSPTGINADQSYAKLVDGTTAYEWCQNDLTTDSSGYCIFTTDTAISPTAYQLMIGSDTQSNTGRNPKAYYLYASNSATTFTDTSWKLISSSTDYLPTANYATTAIKTSAYDLVNSRFGVTAVAEQPIITNLVDTTKYSGTGTHTFTYDKAIDKNCVAICFNAQVNSVNDFYIKSDADTECIRCRTHYTSGFNYVGFIGVTGKVSAFSGTDVVSTKTQDGIKYYMYGSKSNYHDFAYVIDRVNLKVYCYMDKVYLGVGTLKVDFIADSLTYFQIYRLHETSNSGPYFNNMYVYSCDDITRLRDYVSNL